MYTRHFYVNENQLTYFWDYSYFFQQRLVDKIQYLYVRFSLKFFQNMSLFYQMYIYK